MKKILTWIFILIILAGAFIYYKKERITQSDIVNNTSIYTNITSNKSVETEWTATGSNGYSFKYPENLGTKYINTVDWPPVLNIQKTTFNCIESGNSENDRAGKTIKENINGKEFCITRESEGAAGSVYTSYAYAFAYENNTMIATFSLRAPQCMNYDNPQQTECINEENSFNISSVIFRVLATIQSIN